MSPRSETIRLYTNFLKLRYQFPNKQGRSVLRRWTTFFFTLRQLQFEQLVRQHGLQHANEHAAQWRRQAAHQYRMSKLPTFLFVRSPTVSSP